MAEGFLITDIKVLPDPLPNQRKETAMSLVAGADYLVSVKDGYELMVNGNPLTNDEFQSKFTEFISQANITVLKKSKKSERELDIKPFIYGFGYNKEEFKKSIQMDIDDCSDLHAEQYENGKKIYLQVAAGSVTNIKPELILEAFCDSIGAKYEAFAYQIHRMETYADVSRRGMSQAMLEKAVEEGSLPPRQLVSLSKLD